VEVSLTLERKKLNTVWKQVGPILTVDSPASYRHACRLLDDLVDEIGSDERHPLAGLMDTLGTLIEAWENEHHPMPDAKPRQVLAFLMEQHGLKQGDLKELGSQGVVSEILSGKRDLNVRQVRQLAKRFKISPAVFI
jgi:HTH-type transcriptional regulator/antitoxin HigA